MPRALVAEDLVQCIKVGGAAVSHDGKCIAYVQRQWHLDSKQSTSDIFLLELPLTGGPAPAPLQLTHAKPGDRNFCPRWGPGGAWWCRL